MQNVIFTFFIRTVTLMAMVCGVWLFAASPAKASWALFKTRETYSSDITPFKKWTGMLARYPEQRALQQGICAKGSRGACVLTKWMNALEGMRGLSRMEQMQRVNSLLNAMPYREDIVNWGVDDFWATPIEFQQRSGDCDDYAIAKYLSLRILGFPVDDMRVLVLTDMNLGVMHAILVVNEGGAFYLLDNQIKQLTTDKRVFHYQPIYSINEEGWWRHSR
jgi:predicted transglutaminase-like cysteine proteinase